MASMSDVVYAASPESEVMVDGDGFGPSLDSLMGMSVRGGNNVGYTLQKIVYTSTFPGGGTDGLVTYRPNMAHLAQLSTRGGGTRTYASFAIDSQQATEMKLVEGDLIVGAHLTVLDGRGPNSRSGTATAGVVPVTNKNPNSGANTVHGVFTPSSEGSKIQALSLDGGSSIGAGSISYIAAHTAGIDVYNPVRYLGQDASAAHNDVATPALCVAYNGVGNTGDLVAKLTIYALVGRRAVGGVSRGGGSIPIEELAKYSCQHTATIGHIHNF